MTTPTAVQVIYVRDLALSSTIAVVPHPGGADARCAFPPHPGARCGALPLPAPGDPVRDLIVPVGDCSSCYHVALI